MILWSIRTLGYKGLATNKQKNQVREKGIYLSKLAAQVRRLIFRKVFIWYLEVNIGQKQYTMTYVRYNIEY